MLGLHVVKDCSRIKGHLGTEGLLKLNGPESEAT